MLEVSIECLAADCTGTLLQPIPRWRYAPGSRASCAGLNALLPGVLCGGCSDCDPGSQPAKPPGKRIAYAECRCSDQTTGTPNAPANARPGGWRWQPRRGGSGHHAASAPEPARCRRNTCETPPRNAPRCEIGRASCRERE